MSKYAHETDIYDFVNFAVALRSDYRIEQFRVYPIIHTTMLGDYIKNDKNDEMVITTDDTDFMVCRNVPKEIVSDIISAVIWKLKRPVDMKQIENPRNLDY